MSERHLSAKLRSAVNASDCKAVQRLVKGGVDINAKYWFDSTLLHEAVSMASSELVGVLIRAGAEVNSTNQEGRTALHLACRGGNVEIVQALIASGTSVNKRTVDGKTCLHVAVWRGHEEVVQLLINAGANVDIPDSEGCTPLYWAARSNYLSILKMLVCAGAKVNYRVKSRWTPLHIALHLGHMDVVRYLLLQGAETNIMVENKSVVSMLMDNQHLSQQVRQDTLSLLVQAGYNLHKDSWISPLLVSLHGNLSHEEFESRTPITSTSLSLNFPVGRSNDSSENSTPGSTAELMVKWLENRRGHIPTLMCLCRTRIRKRLSFCKKGRSIVNIVPKLPLPSILVNFVGLMGYGLEPGI